MTGIVGWVVICGPWFGHSSCGSGERVGGI